MTRATRMASSFNWVLPVKRGRLPFVPTFDELMTAPSDGQTDPPCCLTSGSPEIASEVEIVE